MKTKRIEVKAFGAIYKKQPYGLPLPYVDNYFIAPSKDMVLRRLKRCDLSEDFIKKEIAVIPVTITYSLPSKPKKKK